MTDVCQDTSSQEKPGKNHSNTTTTDILPSQQSCSSHLEVFLDSRGIQAWDEDYMCMGEPASVSTSSLESHEISEENSSGYNSSGIGVKSKRDSDSLSASSQSDFGEANCIPAPHQTIHRTNSLDSSVLKNTLHELERSMAEILRMNLQNVDQSTSGKKLSKSSQEDLHSNLDNIDFHEAVRQGDAKLIAKLVTAGLIRDLNEPDWNVSGDPPLLVAASNHCLPVLCVLLSSGCNPGVRSPRGETALHRAIVHAGPTGNALKFVKELLQYGCSPGVKEAGGGLTALHMLTRQLAHAYASKNSHYDFEEALETISILAKAGAVNDKDHQGRSALHFLAASTIFDNNQRSEIEAALEKLLEAGADPTLKNDRGETPLHESLECGALVTASLLMLHTPAGIVSRYGETPLHIAAKKNYIDIVDGLLKNGEDPSLQDAGGNTPLHLAAARGFHQIVSLLVTSSLVQIEKVNDENLTALQVAAESGFISTVQLLLKAGADPVLTLHHRHPDIFKLIDHELARRRKLAT